MSGCRPSTGRHEAVGNRQLVATERPTPFDIPARILAVEIGGGAQHVGALARDAIEDIAIDAVLAATRRRTFEPSEERARPLLAEQVLDAVAERERARVDRAQRVVVDEPARQPAADVVAMLEIAPTATEQLACVAFAEPAQHRRAADTRATGVGGESMRALGIESGQVEQAQRPRVVDAHAALVLLKRVPIEVPQAQIEAGVLEQPSREPRRRELQGAREPRAVL